MASQAVSRKLSREGKKSVKVRRRKDEVVAPEQRNAARGNNLSSTRLPEREVVRSPLGAIKHAFSSTKCF